MTTDYVNAHRFSRTDIPASDIQTQVLTVRGSTSLVVATPSSDPGLWLDYLDGARASYASHGVSMALEYDTVVRGECTSLFYAAVDEDGTVIGGVRAQGPYVDPHQSHALLEWAGQPGLELVTEAIRSRLDEGIVEMKTAWAADGPAAPTVAGMLARLAIPTFTLMGTRYIMATAADHVLRRWESAGGRVAEDIPASPYPDNRYRTSLMWWDRETLAADADPAVYAQMVATSAPLTTNRQSLFSPSRAGAA
ncbi:hypothetical protein [Williamsia soli]|uniref:hypothetical protein n=1 Tax=Williamsia soli TaxID=364929 RepID=UPI001A9D1159|nr:hypothetical protein [Williamsia soli]